MVIDMKKWNLYDSLLFKKKQFISFSKIQMWKQKFTQINHYYNEYQQKLTQCQTEFEALKKIDQKKKLIIIRLEIVFRTSGIKTTSSIQFMGQTRDNRTYELFLPMKSSIKQIYICKYIISQSIIQNLQYIELIEMEDSLAYKLCTPLPLPPLKNTLTQQQITKVCSDITCDKRPFIQSPEDPQLFHNDHLTKIIDVEAFASQFCEEMSRLANQNIVLYQEFMQNKENVSLLQILEQGDAHLQKIDEMVIRQKTELAIDITNLQEKIMVVIQSIKEENMKRLDSFNEQYKQSFITLKANIDQFFLLSRQNFYYSNQNTFQYKLASLGTPEAQQFLSNLKNHLNKSKQLSQGNVTPLQMLTDLQTLARFLLQMTNSPPNYDKLQNPQTNILDSVVNEVGFVLNNVVSARLYIPFGSNKELSQVQTGENNLQLQMAARNIDNFQLKPTKKFTIGTQITCILSILDYLFAIGSQNDSQLRIFDTTQKKISAFSGHSQNIVYLEKICTSEANSRQFVSLGQDKQLIVWNIDDIMISTQPRVFRKIQLSQMPNNALDLKDNTHIAFSDLNRDINICNFYTQKIGTNNTKHLNKINGLTLLKKGEKFISYSSDSIINIWRLMKYGSSQDPVLICDQNLHDPLYGSISQIFITTQWPGHCIIVSNEGAVKLFDFNKNCIVFSKFGNRKILSTLMESVLIEVSDQKINPPIWLITFSFNDNLATQHHLSISPYAMHSSDIKLGHQLTVGQQIYGKHKVQLFTQSSPTTSGSGKIGSNILMFSSDTSDELLMYELKGI
ncbi:unnamed protein product [Paramecium pentaurelia]|uniref:Uncharacterized protein n=1 Tax=Paramecium pentaurelia TaxID=43138 RepID=A0A8S1UPV5_9CILI|nr:unnamed protein product [Paramecium pentaurelia]